MTWLRFLTADSVLRRLTSIHELRFLTAASVLRCFISIHELRRVMHITNRHYVHALVMYAESVPRA